MCYAIGTSLGHAPFRVFLRLQLFFAEQQLQHGVVTGAVSVGSPFQSRSNLVHALGRVIAALDERWTARSRSPPQPRLVRVAAALKMSAAEGKALAFVVLYNIGCKGWYFSTPFARSPLCQRVVLCGHPRWLCVCNP